MPSFISTKDTKLLLEWIDEYITKPHPEIGRKGAVCPFVQPSIKKDSLSMTFHYEINGNDTEALESLTCSYIDKFLNLPDARDPVYQALLVVFPSIPEERGTIIDVVHERVKTRFVERGLMLGQFHQDCPEPATRNPFFSASTSPMPLFVIRYMALHDILFLREKEIWFAEYYSQFGSKYELGQVSNKEGFVDLFNEAKERFPEVAKRCGNLRNRT